MADIVVLGSIVQDLVSYTSRFPRPGEAISGSFSMAPGGKGANQAAQAAMLGATVTFIGCVGNDTFGTINVDSLKQCGVLTEYVDVSKTGPTGCATITVAENGENTIVVSLGANLEIAPSRIDAVVTVIASAKIFLCQLENSVATVHRALQVARKHNVWTFLNFAPAIPNFDKSLLQLVDILCTNEVETESLCGQKVSNVEEAMRGVSQLLKLGPKTAIATLGANGVVYACSDGKTGHIAVPAVQAVETTGAGDSFCGALAFFLVKRVNLSIDEQIRRAALIASKSVQRKGTRDSYLRCVDLPTELIH